MAVASHLLVIAVMAVVSYEGESQPNRDGGVNTCSETLQSQVLPNSYIVFKHNSILQKHNDTTCLKTVCSIDRGSSKLSDCNLGPENSLPRQQAEYLKYFYKLKYEGTSMQTFRWLAFIFNETFDLETVKIYYYCTPRGSHLKITLQYHYNRSHYTDMNSTGLNCQGIGQSVRRELNIETAKDDHHRSIKPGREVAITLKIPSSLILFLSEVQFFKDTDEDVALLSPTPSQKFSSSTMMMVLSSLPSTQRNAQLQTSRPSSGCYATTIIMQSHHGGLATVTTTQPHTLDVITRGGQKATIVGAAVGTSAGVLLIGITAAIICTISVAIFRYQKRHDINDTEMQAEDGLPNPVYSNRALGQAAKTGGCGFANPGYSSTVISNNSPDNQHDSHNASRPDRDTAHYYAVLEGPTPITSHANRPQHYEEHDENFHHSCSSPVESATSPSISAGNAHTYEHVTPFTNNEHLEGENRQHFHRANQPQIVADSSNADHVYSHLDNIPPGKKIPSYPLYSHLLHDSYSGQREREEDAPNDPSYSCLLRQQEGDQKADVMAAVHNTYSHPTYGERGHGLSQNGTSPSISSFCSDTHA